MSVHSLRLTLLCAATLFLAALPAVAFERREIKTKDRVLGTITADLHTHEYLIEVPRDGLLTMSLPRVKGSTLQGSMSLTNADYRFQNLFLIGARKVQMQVPATSSGTYRALVQGVNSSTGDYLLKPKLKVRKGYKIRGQRSQLTPPGQILFGALAGYEAQVTVTWRGPEPVTIASFTGPSGSDPTSALPAKEKKASFRQKGFVITETGDHRVVLDIPATAKSWTLAVKLKGKPVGTELLLREAHAAPPELTLELSSGPNALIRIKDEVGGPNELVLNGAHRAPTLFGAFGSEPQACGVQALESGSAPGAYLVTCDETHSALVTVGERDENLRILDYVADPIVTPSGAGTVSFSEFTYTTPTSSQLTGWTETRTFAESGNAHTLVVSDVRRINISGGTIAIYTVHHTNAAGDTRRYDFFPFD